MRLIGLAVVLALSLGPLAAGAQPIPKAPRISYLWSSSAAATSHFIEAFRQRLREYGWTEGQNITVEWRLAEGRLDRLLSYSVGVETFSKALEILKETVPSIRRVAFLSNPASHAEAGQAPLPTTAARPTSWTRSSRAPSPLIYPSSSPRSSS